MEDNRTKLQKQFEKQTPTIKGVRSKEYLQTYCTWLEFQVEKQGQSLPIDNVSKRPKWTEIVNILADGTEEVKYRRPYGTVSAQELIDEVKEIQKKSGYFYRNVC